MILTSAKPFLDVCTLPKKPGRCEAYIPRFYFDSSDGRCKKFIYGGCDENGNNFFTKEECEQTCGGIYLYANMYECYLVMFLKLSS